MDAPPGLRGIVLGASFARLDLPLKSVLASVAKFVPVHRIPTRVLASVLLGRWAEPELCSQLAAALSRVSSEVLTARARATLDIDLVRGARHITLPLLYVRASADRLIPSSAAQSVACIASAMTVQEITAPHFLFQTAPEACADAIRRFSEAIT
jgi:pimeloyl-ACP methyl ester carboxylesterase